MQQLPVIKSDVQIRYSDVDALGHVSNTLYGVYLEMSRVEWLLSMPGEHIASVVVNMNINFTGEIKYEDKVHIVARCVRIGHKSVQLLQEIYANDKCVTTAETVLVGFDPKERKTVPLFAGWAPSPAD